MEVAVLKLHIATFIKSKANHPVPVIIDPSLQNISYSLEIFKKKPTDINSLNILAKYCTAFKNYNLSLELLKLASAIQPNEFKYYYFQSLIYFLKQDIDASISKTLQMLKCMNASEYQIKSILARIEPDNVRQYYIYSLNNLLKEFNLSELPTDFDIFVLAYPIKDHNQNKHHLGESAYCHFFTHLSNHLEWKENSTLTNLLEAEYQINQDTAWYHVTLGKLYWILHEREKTDYHFQKAIELSKEQDVVFNTDCGVYTWLPDNKIKSLLASPNQRDPFELDRWQWSYAELNGVSPDISIIIGCDSGYFRFFPKMLLSLIKAHRKNHYKNPTVISLAIENPSRPQIDFLKKVTLHIQKHVPNLFLTYGYGICEHQDAAYFASLRYLWAPELFQLYPTQTYIIDIDAIFPEDFYSKTNSLSKNYDFGLRLFAFNEQGNQIFGEPWCLGAGILYINETTISINLLNFLKLYILNSYEGSCISNWCIDQSALSQGYDYYIRINFNFMRIKDIDIDCPIILSQSYENKEIFYISDYRVDMGSFFIWERGEDLNL